MIWRISTAVARAPSWVRRSNLCRTASASFSPPKSILTSFSASLSKGPRRRERPGLTRSSLFELFCGQRKGGDQLHYYFDYYFIHDRCRRDPGIYIETLEKNFYRLEQVDECIVAVDHILGRLMHSDVIMTRMSRLKKDTYNKQNTQASVYCLRRRECL